MDLDALLSRARDFETRAAALYRLYAARTRANPECCALWTALARDEEHHAEALTRASRWLDRSTGWHTRLDGWDEAIEEIEGRLAEASRPEIGADCDRMLVAALALERTELDTLYHRLVTLVGTGAGVEHPEGHTQRLLAFARRSKDPAVQLEAGLLRARLYLRHTPPHPPPRRETATA
jgi:rubrerythrin